jgi:hypothetical protein
MALDHVTKIIVIMQNAEENDIDPAAASYFDQTFKAHFKGLERSITSNWRLHKAYFDALGELCLMTKDVNEAKDIVTVMLNTIKGKICSLPVKKQICEKMAQMISTRQNYLVRQLIHKVMMTTLATSRSSQQRQTFLFFLEYLLPLISSAHFN